MSALQATYERNGARQDPPRLYALDDRDHAAWLGAVQAEFEQREASEQPATTGEPPSNLTEVSTDFAARILTRRQLRTLPVPEPLIADTLDRYTSAVIAGEWGAGKSFLALDWALCVATGKPWQGRAVTHSGPVLYVAAEGAYGFDTRITAWENAWRKGEEVAAFDSYPQPVNLLNRGQVEELVDHVHRRRYVLVVFDTLARCMPGGDENSARDMGIGVAALDSVKRATDGGVALGVHHLGKDKTAGPRGSSALASGVDTLYVADKIAERIMRLHREKRKDGPTDDTLNLELAVTGGSCIVQKATRALGLVTPSAVRVHHVMSSDMSNVGVTPSELGEVLGWQRSSVQAALSSLLTAGLVTREKQGKTSRYALAGD